jgi:hypothetical protein
MVSALAMDSRDDGCTGAVFAFTFVVADARVRKKPEGVGKPLGALWWREAERSSKVARGELNGL